MGMSKKPSEATPAEVGVTVSQGQSTPTAPPRPIATADDIVVSIIIVTYEGMDLLERCLQAIRLSKISVPYEVIIVDNGSKSWDRERVLRLFPNAHLIENSKNGYYARANNQGIEIARGIFLLLLNSDAFLGRHTLEQMLEFMAPHKNLCTV